MHPYSIASKLDWKTANIWTKKKSFRRIFRKCLYTKTLKLHGNTFVEYYITTLRYTLHVRRDGWRYTTISKPTTKKQQYSSSCPVCVCLQRFNNVQVPMIWGHVTAPCWWDGGYHITKQLHHRRVASLSSSLVGIAREAHGSGSNTTQQLSSMPTITI